MWEDRRAPSRSADTRRIPAGTRIVGDKRERLRHSMRRQFEQGTSIRSLAKQHSRSYGFVHRLPSESGAQLRRRGAAAVRIRAAWIRGRSIDRGDGR